MRILLTNDDSIHAECLQTLTSHLIHKHEVTVVAPLSEMSGVSHSFTIFSPLFVREIKIAENITGFGVSGTPADCVKLGIKKLMKAPPDLLLSGMNCGENSGISAVYSGTVSGAREGMFFSIPSVSLSLTAFSKAHIAYALSWLDRFLDRFMNGRIPFNPATTFLNVNFPSVAPEHIKGTRLTRQGTSPFNDDYEKRQNPAGENYFWLFGNRPHCHNDRFDESALQSGYVTVTPLTADMTDHTFFERYETSDLFNS
ncbi:MAG: 5'/3'-nucleotidase SurE [Elusimicrobia bacterium RIFOXYB2_FULL_49_7]|nr:MAG: 5'/3'-nucleotidase SurE [Elusimicrobia bacterium RIFOXYB2_FULL_49_7]